MVRLVCTPADPCKKGGGQVAKTILKRVLQIIPVLFVVVTFTFMLTRMIPGDPATMMLGPQASPDALRS